MWMLTTSKIYNILFEVAEYRNKWEGHGPIVDSKELQKRLEILRGCLHESKKIISENYKEVFLVSPLKTAFTDGIYHYQAENLMTSRAPFKTVEIETKLPMDSTKKYLVYKGQYIPIELLQLVDIVESPEKEQQACYFYNGIDRKSKKAHYISYHFSKEAEYYIEPSKLENTFKFLG